MEQAGMTVKDLVPFIGPLNRVYEVLSHKRSLSLSMIRRLSEGLHIPAEVLIRESEPVAARQWSASS
jgi:HTH-type transcriptional regulator/antitoxin HigA